MKKFYLLTKTLLVAVCLLVGASNAWGATVWKTYKTWDFITDFAASDVSSLLPEGSWTTSGSGKTTVAEVTTTISSATAVTTTVNNRYYGIKLEGAAGSSRLTLSQDGIRIGGGATKVTIPNLKKGQRITLKLSANKAISSSQLSNITVTGSSSPYTCTGIVASDGDVVLARPDNTTFFIRSILVETPIVDAVYSQDFTGVTEKPADWTTNDCTNTFTNNMTITLNENTNSRNGKLDINSSVSSLSSNNWSMTFKTSINPGNNQSGQEIAVWGTKSSMNNGKKTYLVSSNGLVGYHITDKNAFFQAYNTAASGTSYTVYFADNEMETVTLEASTEYIFTVHCTNIDTDKNTADLQVIIVKAGTGAEVYNESHSINTDKTGTLRGLFFLNARYNSVTTFDDIYLTQSVFTLGESSKTVDIADNGTVSVTGISGNISVVSANTAIATASYSDGSVTINGVAKGTTTITVYCSNNGVTTSKTIDVTVRGYDELYAEEKAPYDSKVENLDAAGQAYWTANVTSAASVTDEASYNTAVAALPTTYVASVKAQTTAGSNMTDALKTAVEAASWTGATGTYADVAAERYAGDNSHFSTGNILHQTVSGLHAGYYKLKFYGVANRARNIDAEYYGAGIAQIYANDETLDVDVIDQAGCTPISDTYLRTFEVYLSEDNSSIDFGIKNIKEGGQWYVAQALSLTYLGTEKKTYTINAVAGEATIKELATGSAWASETYGTYVPKAVLYNSKYYVLDDGDNENLSGYYASYTMGATNETKEINYTLDESIVAYTEGEGSSYRYVTASNNPAYSCGDYVNASNNNGNLKRNRGFDLGTLPKGMYQMVAYVINTTKSRSVALRNIESEATASDPIIQVTNSGKITGELTANFQLTESTKLRVNGANNADYSDRVMQMEEIDYVLIRKTGEVATIGSRGYATFSSTNPVNVDADGLEAFIASGESGNYVTMEKVTGDVAAGTGLVLKGTVGNYALPFAATSGTTYNQSSNPKNYLFALDGTFDNVNVAGSGTNYVLSVQSGNVVWAPVTSDVAPAPAGHAALWLPGGVSTARAMRFSGDITGVENVEAAEATAKKNGAYLENGKIAIYKNGMKYNANGQLIK